MPISELEQEMWRKYQRMTGIQHPVGYSDVLHVLLSPDLLPYLKQLIEEREELDGC